MKKGITNIKNHASSVAAKPTRSYNWSQGLIAAINDGESKIYEDDFIVIIRDKYPKARVHYLILPKKNIPEINKVEKEDLELINHMKMIANKYADMHKECKFQIGFHQVPSMQRLHLHVISTDFDSPCLKTKQHWNTFTTPYFLPIEDAIKQLEENGFVKVDRNQCKEYLKKELQCHKCSRSFRFLPDLKRHVLEMHFTPKS